MAATLNTIGYALYENRLKGRGTETRNYYARVLPRGRVGEDDLVRMITERNSTVTRQEVTAVLDLLYEVVKTSLRMGCSVSTRLFHTSLSIHGVFDTMSDGYDPARHALMLKVTPAKSLKDYVAAFSGLEKDTATLPTPTLFSLYDYASGERDVLVTPGNTASLVGVNLAFDAEADGQGVYFVSDTDPAGVKADRVISASGKKIVFQVPASLSAGTYTVEIRCGFGSILRAAKLVLPVTVV